MKIKYTNNLFFHRRVFILFIMKTFIFLFCTAVFSFSPGKIFSQNAKIIIDADKTVTVDEVFDLIRKQTKYNFIYQEDLFKNVPKVQLKKGVIEANKLLEESLSTTYFNFELTENNTIAISKKSMVRSKVTAQAVIRGAVTDEKGFAIPGVTVSIKGTNLGVVTDSEGKFIVVIIDPNPTLVFSSIGFETQEVEVRKQTIINVQLRQSLSKLDEVQVTAYGKTSKRLSTGSIVTIGAEEIQRSPVQNVLEAVQGRVPGVFIQQQSGRPGSPFAIQIRGRNSLNNIDPLIIIDGVTYPSGGLPVQTLGLNSILRGGNALDFLDPNMIESINFLKDADATSIYGSRGSYGVIIITTKKGKIGKPRLNVSTTSGFSYRGKSTKLLNTADYLAYRRESISNNGVVPGPTDLDVNGTWSESKDTDWTDFYLGNAAFTSNTNAIYSGGSESTTYLFGANHNTTEDIQSAKGKNKTGGLNLSFETRSKNSKFKMGFSGSYSATNNNLIAYDFVAGSRYLLAAPNAPSIYNLDGSLNWTDYPSDNPGRVYNQIHENKTDNLVANLRFDYSPVKGLTLSNNFGFNVLSSNEIFASPSTFFNPATAYITTSTLNTYRIRTLTVEPNAKYTTKLGSRGNITAQVGATIQDKLQSSQSTIGSDFLSDDQLYNPTTAAAANVITLYNDVTGRYIGSFGILSYNWANKYLININARRDGSTKFGENNRFGNFGSIGAGWIFSEENLFKNNIKVISFGKVRGSYGTSGGDGISEYSYVSRYLQTGGGGYNNGVALTPTGLSNPYLNWERNNKGDLNLNLEFFNGRIGIDGTYYWNESNNLLVQLPLSTVTGSTGVAQNSPAEIKNWGYEFLLNTKNIITKNFSWSTDFNISVPKSELASYPTLGALPNANYVVGKPITGIKLYKYEGVNPATGDYNFFKDVNQNGVVDTGEIATWLPIVSVGLDANKDKTEFIDLAPKFYGGINNTLTYKNITLNVFFTFTKRMAKNFLGSQSTGMGTPRTNIAQELYDDRWQQPGDITNVPRPTTNLFNYLLAQNNFFNSTGAYSDATYARLQNLDLSYNFSLENLKKLHLQGLTLSIKGQNLFTISKYKSYDPENLGAGTAPLRTVVLGINLTL